MFLPCEAWPDFLHKAGFLYKDFATSSLMLLLFSTQRVLSDFWNKFIKQLSSLPALFPSIGSLSCLPSGAQNNSWPTVGVRETCHVADPSGGGTAWRPLCLWILMWMQRRCYNHTDSPELKYWLSRLYKVGLRLSHSEICFLSYDVGLIILAHTYKSAWHVVGTQ